MKRATILYINLFEQFNFVTIALHACCHKTNIDVFSNRLILSVFIVTIIGSQLASVIVTLLVFRMIATGTSRVPTLVLRHVLSTKVYNYTAPEISANSR